MILPLEISKTQKPYCVCSACGIQLFFRAQTGIRRLQELVRTEKPISQEFSQSCAAISIYNRLEQLKKQREELEQKQGIFFRDRALDNAILALDAEVARLEAELEQTRKEAEKKKR
jgi:hypothetical protein